MNKRNLIMTPKLHIEWCKKTKTTDTYHGFQRFRNILHIEVFYSIAVNIQQ